MARRRKGRAINGVLLLDKASGITSNKALQQVRYLFKAQKAGHTGSLDPLASGLLPICLGEATKFSQYLLNADKTYEVTGKLGEKTTTSDAEGEIVETAEVNVVEQDIQALIPEFSGEIEQVPSMYSALKHQGKPLYEYARAGITIEREARKISIYELELTHFEAPYFSMRVKCSKGTYIRNLVEDIGDRLGCGAHVTVLRRTGAGHFTADEMLSFEALETKSEDLSLLDELLKPMDILLEGYPEAHLESDMTDYFLHGQPVFMPSLPLDEIIRVYDHSGRFLGVAKINDDGMLAPKRLVNY